MIAGMYENLEPLPRDEEREVARRARDGDPRAVDRLVRHNAGFAATEARRFSGWLPAEDLMQEAMTGLVVAARRYDPDHSSGTKFISYAVWWVRRQLLHAVAREGHAVPLTGGANRDASRVSSARDALGPDAGPGEVAEETGIREERVRRLWNVTAEAVRLEQPTGPGDEGEDRARSETFLPAAVPPPEAPGPREEVRDAVDALPPHLATVVRRRFGLDGDEPWSYARIGKAVGMTGERARQLVAEAVELLADGSLGRYGGGW